MKNAIITGATGIIGSALVEILCNKGVDVLAIVRPNTANLKNILKYNINIIECELADINKIKVDKKYDAFYHLGWDKTFGEDRDDVEIQLKNIGYTLEAVRFAKKCGCKIFIGAGSQAEYGPSEQILGPYSYVNPESGYGIAKYSAGNLSRLLCNQLEIKHCWTRILSVYGEKESPHTLISYCIHCFERGIKPSLTKCEQIWDYIYSEDAAMALYLIGKKGKKNEVYCIGSGKGRKLSEYIKIIRDIINPTAEIGFGEREYYPHQPMYLCADIQNLKNDTGFFPKITFEEGIKKMILKHSALNYLDYDKDPKI